MDMNQENELHLYDVVELLLENKDNIIDSIQWDMIKVIEQEYIFDNSLSDTVNNEFIDAVLRELRLFAINKLDITAEDAMAFIDEDIVDICPELAFYFKKETYYGNI